jgi:hypothetical protein
MPRDASKRHPAQRIIDNAYNARDGHVPPAWELDDLQLPATHRRRVLEACEQVAELKASGANQAAQATADELGAQIISELPEDMQRLDYLRPADRDDTLDPAALAARVRTW